MKCLFTGFIALFFLCQCGSEIKPVKNDFVVVPKVDTLKPEKIKVENLHGSFFHTDLYGKWGLDLVLGDSNSIVLKDIGDTLGSILIGKWHLKGDTLVANYTKQIFQRFAFIYQKHGSDIRKETERFEEPANEEDKFIFARGYWVRLAFYGNENEFSPEVFSEPKSFEEGW